jgi:hypothetical protein
MKRGDFRLSEADDQTEARRLFRSGGFGHCFEVPEGGWTGAPQRVDPSGSKWFARAGSRLSSGFLLPGISLG